MLSFLCKCKKRLGVMKPALGQAVVCPFCSSRHELTQSTIDAMSETTTVAESAEETYVLVSTPGGSGRKRPDEDDSSFIKQLGMRIGQLEVVEVIGRGAMGIVLKCHDPGLDRDVAVKFLTEELSSDAELVERFRREARAAAALSHPHIVHIYAIGDVEGRPYFAMEFVDGHSLADALHDGKRLPAGKAADYVLQAARGLAAAAAGKGIVHRDVKPSNLMLGKDGFVRVADFGLAKLTKSSDASITGTGIVVGTPFYMAPEQGKGEKVDLRADIYSLGATFYHLLYGKPPFQGKTPLQVMLKHVSEKVEFPDVDGQPLQPEIAGVIRKMMGKTPEDRYQDYASLIADLERLGPQAETRAGFWVRMTAAVLDLIISGVIVLGAVVALSLVAPKKAGGLSLFILYMFFPVYFVLFHSVSGQTPGKRVMKIVLLDDSGRGLRIWRVFARYFAGYFWIFPGYVLTRHLPFAPLQIAAFVLSISALLGLLFAIFRKDKRAFHDIIAKTKVVYRM
jgi:uncharacterized RDD family membrane protein YckC/predicted Ser/Thr protein kinase